MDIGTVVVGALVGIDILVMLTDMARRKGEQTGKMWLLERQVKWLESRVGWVEKDLSTAQRDIRDLEGDLSEAEERIEHNAAELKAAYDVTKVLIRAILELNSKVNSLDQATAAHLEDEDAHVYEPEWAEGEGEDE